MSQITLTKIVTLINGIIQHGNHSHTEHTPEKFAELLQKMSNDNEQIDDKDQELLDLYEEINNSSEDFTIEFDGNEYRIIADACIWSIYVETIKETVLDCYDLKLDKIPDFVDFNIEWEQTAKNCYADGYGFTFASYDGEESEAGEFWIFRTN